MAEAAGLAEERQELQVVPAGVHQHVWSYSRHVDMPPPPAKTNAAEILTGAQPSRQFKDLGVAAAGRSTVTGATQQQQQQNIVF